MLTICFALKSELLPFTDRFPVQEKRVIAGGGTLYRSARIHLLRTGVGPKAETVFKAYLEQVKPGKVWNVGLAGALNTQRTTADIFRIKRVRSLPAEHWLPISEEMTRLEFPAADLLTVPKAVTNAAQRDALFKQTAAELVDMEAFFLAQLCSEYHIPFTAFKMVSDFADRRTESDFLNNLQAYSRRLARALDPLLIKRLS